MPNNETDFPSTLQSLALKVLENGKIQFARAHKKATAIYVNGMDEQFFKSIINQENNVKKITEERTKPCRENTAGRKRNTTSIK